MSKPNWFDTVEYRLAKVVEAKAAGFVRLLAAAWKNMGAKTGGVTGVAVTNTTGLSAFALVACFLIANQSSSTIHPEPPPQNLRCCSQTAR